VFFICSCLGRFDVIRIAMLPEVAKPVVRGPSGRSCATVPAVPKRPSGPFLGAIAVRQPKQDLAGYGPALTRRGAAGEVLRGRRGCSGGAGGGFAFAGGFGGRVRRHGRAREKSFDPGSRSRAGRLGTNGGRWAFAQCLDRRIRSAFAGGFGGQVRRHGRARGKSFDPGSRSGAGRLGTSGGRWAFA
jgi:hypothetical protein